MILSDELAQSACEFLRHTGEGCDPALASAAASVPLELIERLFWESEWFREAYDRARAFAELEGSKNHG